MKKKFRKKYSSEENKEQTDEVKVLAEDSGLEEEKISQEVSENSEAEAESSQNEHDDDDEDEAQDKYNDNDEALDDDDDDEDNLDFELQRKLIKSRKLYHRQPCSTKSYCSATAANILRSSSSEAPRCGPMSLKKRSKPKTFL